MSSAPVGAQIVSIKIREFLQVPAGHPCKIERYSDSAGSYVVLDRLNISVYKQLHRAAKAKAKLKIRVTDLEPAGEAQQPKPVTVEAEEEPQAEAAAAKESSENVSEMADTPSTPEQPQPATWSVPLRPRSAAVEAEEEHQVAQSLAAAPEVPKKEPIQDFFANPIADIAPKEAHDSTAAVAADLIDFPTVPAQPPVETARVCPYANPYASLGFGDYRVCCNSCERTIADVHYHCNKCDDDDFDLCLSCVKNGITCYGPDHWMIKRFRKNGVFVTSTTETLPPKFKLNKPEPPSDPIKDFEELRKRLTRDLEAAGGLAPAKPSTPPYKPLYNIRACNSCVQERPEQHFLHCTTCEDFDLCTKCFAKDNHGHHPKHAFVPAVPDAQVDDHISAKLGAGRNQTHDAICDTCDKFIRGIRHKCLDCPDWDYCNDCVSKAASEHPGHRFAPIYEPLPEPSRFRNNSIHVGICCDGPLCAANPVVTYITGVRYKCAVCPDTDLCAACEAHPSNSHNRTHPLIKFKTAVRRAVVSTTGLDGEGLEMPMMGDAPPRTTKSQQPTISSPRAVVSVEPSEPALTKEEVVQETKGQTDSEVPEAKEEEHKPEDKEVPVAPVAEKKVLTASDLGAVYVRDTVMDGTVLPPNHVFEQTWVLRNSSDVAWPAGCAVKFVGGDYMGHVDSAHPAGISELVSASESTVCYDALEPGHEYPFTVLLRTPPREGKIISYWRLTTPEGLRFGHRLWCDVSVEAPKAASDAAEGSSEGEAAMKKGDSSIDSSQVVFPKLEKESPVSSVHQEAAKKGGSESAGAADLGELDGWKSSPSEAWDGSDDGFFTDEEYDILDASDEEFLEEQKLKALKK
ncbi:related to ZZ type zinc finger domain protein [Cephalotrichum gorgonifer]|uniref:Related to ZZ type zinc finger domain protein n=1 Tax=Cephalotrichum gorgonifer TaxID=2041049 RepID=A0AAE8MS29_9PEZI|nr:related to ZZ type zinc finger domain protein [Cephalotrichum gorgonifer]